jgi:LPXTG-site transpeptidase (sortase) family protein
MNGSASPGEPFSSPHTLPKEQPFADPVGAPSSKPFATAPRLNAAPKPAPRQRHKLAATLASASLMLAACTMLGFSLWETRVSGWLAQRSQGQLREQFASGTSAPELLEAWGATVREIPLDSNTPSETTQKAAAVPVAPAVPQLPRTGQLVGQLRIPAIALDWMVVAGTDGTTLRKGPGAWLYGAFPGAPGNATLSAHRTTYGGPFRRLGDLKDGDQVFFTSPTGAESVFEVRGMGRVSPDDVYVTDDVPGVRLTLLTCDPPGSSARRLVVQAELVSGPFIANALAASEWEFIGK